MLQGFGSLLYVLLCPYLISLIIDGMKMVKSNGYKSFPDGITELLMFDDINHSENTLEDYGSDIETNSEEDKSGDQIQNVFLICVVNALVYEKMMSFCKTIWILIT